MLLRRFAGARSVLSLLLLSLAAIGLPSACRDVVAGNGVDAARELCELLEDCYPDDVIFGGCDAFVSKLEDAPTATRQSFLAGLDLEKCGESCPAARQCMDAAPFCGASSCDDELDCCGWSAGSKNCDQGRCCAPLGLDCKADGDCCVGTCDDGTCGGRPCATIDEACDTGDECCSGICRDDVCTKRDCALAGEGCSLPTDCCPAEEQGYEPGTLMECDSGTCTPILMQACQEEFFPCDPGIIDCCVPFVCITDVTNESYCSSGVDCAPLGAECLGQPCCEGECLNSTDPPTCQPPMECLNDADICSFDFECCSGFCEKTQPTNPTGVCSQCWGASCNHDPCTSGDPLLFELCDPVYADCVAIVSQIDSWCRCRQWDSLCTSEAQLNCMGCPTPF